MLFEIYSSCIIEESPGKQSINNLVFASDIDVVSIVKVFQFNGLIRIASNKAILNYHEGEWDSNIHNRLQSAIYSVSLKNRTTV